MTLSALGGIAAVNQVAIALVKEPSERRTLEAALPKAIESDRIAYLQGIRLLRGGDAAAAVAVMESPAARPRQPLSQWFLVQALVASDQIERAAAVLEAMHLDADVLANLALGLQSPDNNVLIKLLAEQALREGGGSIATKRWLGLWSIANSNPMPAIEIIEPIISPEDDYLWSQLGWAYLMLGDYVKAAQAFEHSFYLRPETPLYRLRLAQAYQARNEQGDHDQARVLLEDLVSEGAGANAEAWHTLGWNYYISNRGIDAVAAFEKVVGMEPNNSYYQLRLAQALVLRSVGDDRVQAIALLQKAIAQSPNLAEAANLLQKLTSAGQ